MRRSLVLTNEAVRHPFRASLPPRNPAARRLVRNRVSTWRKAALDTQGVLNSYVAGFVATLAFII